ncbi:MAG TPA: tetratricopeptide repeat protein [Saprospiraceae bacterium]|nr:tetratricopeptide repeat protein [Saprospiraceae bacterium]HRK80316.1 tetratricopeptide repeat protein [Saprospiraceae bacterium]
MKKYSLLFLPCLLLSVCLTAQPCPDKPYIKAPELSDAVRKTFEAQLAQAQTTYEARPDDADALIWMGRRTAYLGRYMEAIELFGKGVEKHPADARFLRHRGHRYLTVRCFDAAIEDFQAAARLTRRLPDEVEPDGLPNARNIPTSTLQSNIWYHLALAHYLKGDFKKALPAWKRCVELSQNPDGLVSSTHWYYMTARRLGLQRKAEKALQKVGKDLDIIENQDYYTLIQLYQGRIGEGDVQKMLRTTDNALSNASLGYGYGNWLWYNGRQQEARQVFAQITQGSSWAAFGFIAAEAELSRK